MKNLFILGISILFLLFTFITCDKDDESSGLPETAGKVTITGLGEYIDKYIYATGSFNNGAAILSAGGTNVGNVKISGDSVNLKIWAYNSGALSNFSQSGSGGLAVYIFNSATDYPGSTPHASGSVSLTFNNGDGGTAAFVAADPE